MNIPECVRIGSNYYEVELTDEPLILDNIVCRGLIEHYNHVISISTNFGDIQQQEQTFLHEIVHGIVNERSINLKEDDEEFIVDEIAKGLHQVILDNPHMFLNFEFEGEEENISEVE